MLQNRAYNWQKIIWREWRNCHDAGYARQLFELVADKPVSWGTKVMATTLDMITFSVVGLILGFTLTSEWIILKHFLWAGGVIGLVMGYLSSRHLSWRAWMTRLASSLPSQQPSRGLGAALGLMIIGGLVFSPVFWLFLIGLFWGFSGLIKWLNRGQATIVNPYEYQLWYFWWRGRPKPTELESAFDEVFQTEPLARDIRTELLRHSQETRSKTHLLCD